MAYNEELAQRVRKTLAKEKPLEKKMFGGLCFMVRGHMCCGVLKDELIVRVGPKAFEEALAQPGARPMDFTGRPSKGMVYVSPDALEGRALRRWVDSGLRFIGTLPAK